MAFYYEIGEWAPEKHIYILVMIYVLSFLMVSNVKYISFKKVEMFRRHPFHTLVGLVLIFVVIAATPDIMGFIAMVIYVSSGVVSTFMYYRRPAGQEKEGRATDSEAFQSVRPSKMGTRRDSLAKPLTPLTVKKLLIGGPKVYCRNGHWDRGQLIRK